MNKSTLTPEERKEFSILKHIRVKQGFFLPKEKERWDFLFNKLANWVMPKLKEFDRIDRLIEMN